MSEQLTFSLTYRPAFGRHDFVVGSCNEEAVAWIDRYPDWPSSVLVIYGESGCGKSHLASIFSQNHISARSLTVGRALSEKNIKVVLEDIDLLASEEALFHLYNNLTERGGALLITARQLPVFRLKDLHSRLNAAPKVFISRPDEELLSAVLMKAFYDRHLIVDPKIIEYAVLRLPRSFEAVQLLIEAADKLSLSRQQKMTIPLMRQALQEVLETGKTLHPQLGLFENF